MIDSVHTIRLTSAPSPTISAIQLWSGKPKTTDALSSAACSGVEAGAPPNFSDTKSVIAKRYRRSVEGNMLMKKIVSVCVFFCDQNRTMYQVMRARKKWMYISCHKNEIMERSPKASASLVLRVFIVRCIWRYDKNPKKSIGMYPRASVL